MRSPANSLADSLGGSTSAEHRFEDLDAEPWLERPSCTLKHDESFALLDPSGDIVPYAGSTEGVFHQDTRFLSACRLRVNDKRPSLLGFAIRDNTVLTANLTNPDLMEADGGILPRETLHLLRSKFIWQGSVYERVAVQNFDSRTRVVRLDYLFRGDFADLFEVRGLKRAKRGQSSVETETDDRVVLAYQGLGGKSCRTTIGFSPMPKVLDEGKATIELQLAPGAKGSIFVAVDCNQEASRADVARRFFAAFRRARRYQQPLRQATTELFTSDKTFNQVLKRSVSDLRMLATETAQGPYPYAGIPWYSTVFGRDGILTAMQLLWVDPHIAKGVLHVLAATQAKTRQPRASAEPGKILHETRKGEMAELGEVPFKLYYGSVDSTPLFVMLAGMYWERTGDLDTIRDLWPAINQALRWIERHGDLDGDGFIEYGSRRESDLRNQGWKDSPDSVFHADGRLAEGPIALCEAQGYVYGAKMAAARMARSLGEARFAKRLTAQAEAFKECFDASFWSDELGTYVLALDRDKEPCKVRTSNAGHVLFSGIASAHQARRVAEQLMDQSFFSGWGVRTVGIGEQRYNPISYHNGSIWPHDNEIIALGFARYGLREHVARLFAALANAAGHMNLHRLPELFCGFKRQPGTGPTSYPVACAPQAWSSAVPFALLQASLGIEFEPDRETVHFKRPRLPAFIDELRIRRLCIGDSGFDVVLRRHGSSVSVETVRSFGDGHVVIEA